MLVLTRKIDQTIHIGDDIIIQIVEVSRNQVRVGITTPRDIPIWRGEIYEKIKEREKNEQRSNS